MAVEQLNQETTLRKGKALTAEQISIRLEFGSVAFPPVLYDPLLMFTAFRVTTYTEAVFISFSTRSRNIKSHYPNVYQKMKVKQEMTSLSRLNT